MLPYADCFFCYLAGQVNRPISLIHPYWSDNMVHECLYGRTLAESTAVSDIQLGDETILSVSTRTGCC